MAAKQQAVVQIFYTAQWSGGAVRLRSVGVKPDEEEANKGVYDALMELAETWHQMFIWMVAIIRFRETMGQDLAGLVGHDDRVNVGVNALNGKTLIVKTALDKTQAAMSFTSDEFEILQAKAFATSVFGYWEDVIRPRITGLLKIPERSAVSGILGDLRLLCNWFRHPGTNAEEEYFSRGERLPRLLSLKPGRPGITFDDAVLLMQQLNNLVINVNPNELEPFAKLVPADPSILEQLRDQLGPNAVLMSW